MLNRSRLVNTSIRYWIGSESHNIFAKKTPIFRDKNVLYVSPILSEVMNENLSDKKKKLNDNQKKY